MQGKRRVFPKLEAGGFPSVKNKGENPGIKHVDDSIWRFHSGGRGGCHLISLK